MGEILKEDEEKEKEEEKDKKRKQFMNSEQCEESLPLYFSICDFKILEHQFNENLTLHFL